MNYATKSVLTLVLVAVVSASLPSWAPSMAMAKETTEQTAADAELESLLDEAELFYQKKFNEENQRWEYKIAWTEDGDTSMMLLYLRELGTRGDGTVINVIYGWTQAFAMPSGQDLPPAIIKSVAATNDNLFTGNISATGGGVYVNAGAILQDLTDDALWLYLWDMHDTRVKYKAEIDKIMANQ